MKSSISIYPILKVKAAYFIPQMTLFQKNAGNEQITLLTENKLTRVKASLLHKDNNNRTEQERKAMK